jgi:hypothetical protein
MLFLKIKIKNQKIKKKKKKKHHQKNSIASGGHLISSSIGQPLDVIS